MAISKPIVSGDSQTPVSVPYPTVVNVSTTVLSEPYHGWWWPSTFASTQSYASV